MVGTLLRRGHSMPFRSRAGLTAAFVCLFHLWAAAAVPRPVFVCPMHPDVRGASVGTCPRCHMVLVETSETDGAYTVQASFEDPVLASGRPSRVRLRVGAPGGDIVSRFVEVHERLFHLFVISQD